VDEKSITIEQLLLHTSGLKQDYLSDGITDRDSAISAILRNNPTHSPGSDFSYSNENYELLAGIIEVVSGKRYEDFVRENILIKAKMEDTKFWSESLTLRPNEVAQINRTIDPVIRKRNWGYIGSSGIFTNVSDLYRWFTSLNSGNILDSENLSLMWSPQKKLTTTSVTYGWYISTTDEGIKELWTRGTEDWGHNGVLRWFPERNTLIIVQTNSGEIGNDKSVTGNRVISDGIVKILFE
jgi:CubicO group peptidase (beta-lactamase class C family)